MNYDVENIARKMIYALHKYPPYREAAPLTVEAAENWLRINIADLTNDTFYNSAVAFVDTMAATERANTGKVGWYHRDKEIKEVEGIVLEQLMLNYPRVYGELETFIIHLINDYNFNRYHQMESYDEDDGLSKLHEFYRAEGCDTNEAIINVTNCLSVLNLGRKLCQYRIDGSADRAMLISALITGYELRLDAQQQIASSLNGRMRAAKMILSDLSDLQGMN